MSSALLSSSTPSRLTNQLGQNTILFRMAPPPAMANVELLIYQQALRSSEIVSAGRQRNQSDADLITVRARRFGGGAVRFGGLNRRKVASRSKLKVDIFWNSSFPAHELMPKIVFKRHTAKRDFQQFGVRPHMRLLFCGFEQSF